MFLKPCNVTQRNVKHFSCLPNKWYNGGQAAKTAPKKHDSVLNI